MKRRLLKLSVLLLAGAIVNVAVAWGIACNVFEFSEDEDSARSAIAHDSEGWVIEYVDVSRFAGVGSLCYVTSRIRTKGINRPYVEDTPHPNEFVPKWAQPVRALNELASESGSVDLQEAMARGWPLVGLMCRIDPPTEDRQELRAFWCISIAAADPILLPLRPLWPGFAINTIFYAAMMWLLFSIPLALRRRRRLKRGLCPACAYPVGCSPVCTECGNAIASN